MDSIDNDSFVYSSWEQDNKIVRVYSTWTPGACRSHGDSNSWPPTTPTATGTLPAKLGELSELEKLDLWDNFLEGEELEIEAVKVQNFLWYMRS